MHFNSIEDVKEEILTWNNTIDLHKLKEILRNNEFGIKELKATIKETIQISHKDLNIAFNKARDELNKEYVKEAKYTIQQIESNEDYIYISKEYKTKGHDRITILHTIGISLGYYYKSFSIIINQINNKYRVEESDNIPITDYIFTNVRELTMSYGDKYRIVDVVTYNLTRNIKTQDIMIPESALGKQSDLRQIIQSYTQGYTNIITSPKIWDTFVLAIKNMEGKPIRNIEYLGLHYSDNVPVIIHSLQNKLKIIKPANVELDEEFYFDKIKLYGNEVFRYKDINYEEWGKVAKTFITNIPYVYTKEKMLAALSWFMATPLKPVLSNHGIPMSQINFFGSHGSGKTTIMQMFLDYFGQITPIDGIESKFVFLKNISYSNIHPFIVDEYRKGNSNREKSIVSEIHKYYRIAYNGGIISKGTSNQGQYNYHLVSPCGLCGEDQIEDSANQDRLLQIRFTKKELETYSSSATKYFSTIKNQLNPQSFITGYNQWLLNKYEQWDDMIEEAIKLSTIISTSNNNQRVVKSAIANIVGLLLARDLCKELEIDDQLFTTNNIVNIITWILDHQKMERATDLEIEFAEFILNNIDIPNEDENEQVDILSNFSFNSDSLFYKIRDNELSLGRNFWIDKFILYKKQLGEDILSKEAIFKRLEEAVYCKAISKQVRFGSRNIRCMVLDLNKMNN